MRFDRVASSLIKEPAGSYIVYSTPLNGGKWKRVKGQPKQMNYVQAHDFADKYGDTYDEVTSVMYQGKK